MIYKLVSIKTVISKVVRELGLGDNSIPYQDFIEVAADAMAHIGAFPQYTPTQATIEVDDFKGELPCDFYKMIRMLDCHYYDSYNPNLVGTEEELQINKFTNRDFNIIHDQITVGYRKGRISIQYLAIPIDDCGLPMIFDDISYQDAIFWRIARFLAIRGELKNRELSFQVCDYNWKNYCLQARANANMPDTETLQRMAYQLNKLKPNLYEYDRLFRGLGK